MPSATISNVGFTAQFAPQIKRATATMSDGTVVMMVPDTNIAAQAGDDTTGTPKIRFYRSNAARTTWTLSFTYTPTPQAMSATKAFVGSMVLGADDRIVLIWQGIDNSLNHLQFSFGAGTWAPIGSPQTIVAANSVTNRYRAIDVDIVSSMPAVIVYESKASAGPSAWTRVYIRNSDNVTWRKAFEYDHATGAGGNIPIYQYSEDVSISWNTAGISANVGQLLIYYTRTGHWYDHGDIVQEIQYNVSTGTDNSATVLGSWPKFNQDIAAGTRRGWIFKTGANLWQVAMVLGSAQPQFQTMRLAHNSFGTPTVDKTTIQKYIAVAQQIGNTPVQTTPRLPQIYFGVNPYNAVGCVYADDRVMFGYLTSLGGRSGFSNFELAATVFRYNNSTDSTASYIDTQMRSLDNDFSYGQQPIGVYGGGNNRNQAGDLKYNFLALYGYPGNATGSSVMNKARAVIDTFYDPPTNVAPTLSVSNDTPVLQARVQNSALYPNIRGKIEWTLARDAAFTTDARTIAEPDANYRYFGSTNAQVPPAFNVSLQLSGNGAQLLYSGTWYMRSRVVSDLGQASAWSITTSFSVSHPPSALTRSPNAGDLIPFGVGGNVAFTWGMSDTEPRDVQTAYRIIVIRLDTGATVTDTGKVTSSAQSVVVSLSSGLMEVPLQWSVSLWDSDNVQGPFSNPVPFTVSNPPAIRVTSPTSGSTVSSAVPSVTWNSTYLGFRNQKAYKVSVFKANILDTFARGEVKNGWGSPVSTGEGTILNANPYFETDASNWTAFGGSRARSTAKFYSGVASLLVTPDGVSATARIESEQKIGTAGRFYQVRAQVNRATAGTIVPSINWYDGTGTYQSTTTGSGVALLANTWTEVTFAAPMPVGCVRGTANFAESGTPAVGDTFNIDEATFRELAPIAQSWMNNGGADSEYSVNSGVGQHNVSAVNSTRKSLIPISYLNSDQMVDFTTTDLVTVTGSFAQFGLIARYIDPNNYIRGLVVLETDGTVTVRIVKYIGGSGTTVSQALNVATWTNGTWWRLRMKVVGDNVYLAAWVGGTNKPGFWHAQGALNGSLQAAGYNGTFSLLGASNTNTLPIVSRFDNYSSYDSNNAPVIATSNWVQDPTTSYTFPSKVFDNLSFYLIKVEIIDYGGMRGEDTVAIRTVWTPPVDGTFSVLADNYGAVISWTNAGIDLNFVSWRVYRRYMKTAMADLDDDNSRLTWVLIYETTANQANYSYKDYLIPNNKPTDYVVVQVADRFGSLIESPISTYTTVTSYADRYYFIPTVPIGSIAAYEAGSVTDDSYTDEVESETLHVIGRGRQVQVGDDLGVTGTLTIQLRNASGTRADREFIQRLASSKNLGVWMKNPFGDVKCVKFLNVQVKLLPGTGTTEMSDLTVPYVEIITSEPVTRA